MRQIWLAAVLAGLAASSGCGDTGRVGDRLDLGQGHSTVCMPAPDSGAAIFGDTTLRNRGDATVAIDAVSLVDARDLTLTAAYLVELGPDESLVGIRDADDTWSLPALWQRRVEATGAVVEPTEEFNLVLVVESHAPGTASAESARIFYRVPSGARFHQDTVTTILVTHSTCKEALRER
jgi:hypothetical protein